MSCWPTRIWPCFRPRRRGAGAGTCSRSDDRAREQADARVTWRDKIAEGLRDDRFQLHFQPIVAIATGAIEHWEALLRLHDTRGDLVYPDRFIPVAEKTGQIQAIDHWVMATPSGSWAGTRACGSRSICPAAPWMTTRFSRTSNACLRSIACRPTRLTFEVTETVAVASLARATELMRGIQRLGCRFALDDFGSGYASYAYLRQLPVDEVKIDGAFIRDLATNREDRIFVKAITDMAHGMGKRVTAEFVENAAIYAVLGELGVDCAQGYYLGRPSPMAEHGPWPSVGSRAKVAEVRPH